MMLCKRCSESVASLTSADGGSSASLRAQRAGAPEAVPA